MFRFFFVGIAFVFLLACCQQGQVIENETIYSDSEIISFFIKKDIQKLNQPASGEFLFLIGPCCKGCVQQNLLELDSLLDKTSLNNICFATSHQFIMQTPFKNIKFIYNKEWEKINYDFRELTYMKIKNDSIISTKVINTLMGFKSIIE